METYLLSNTALSVSGMFFCSSRGKNLTEWKLYFYFQQPTFLVIHKVLFYLETNRRYDATRTINPFTPLVRLLTCGQVGQHQEVSTWTRSSTTRSNKALCFLRNPNVITHSLTEISEYSDNLPGTNLCSNNQQMT